MLFVCLLTIFQSLKSYTWALQCLSQPTNKGTAHYLEDTTKDQLRELADFLKHEFPQYQRGARYLEMLAGDVARPVEDPPRLQFILAGATPPLQRGAPVLAHPEPHQIRRLNVAFHRYHWRNCIATGGKWKLRLSPECGLIASGGLIASEFLIGRPMTPLTSQPLQFDLSLKFGPPGSGGLAFSSNGSACGGGPCEGASVKSHCYITWVCYISDSPVVFLLLYKWLLFNHNMDRRKPAWTPDLTLTLTPSPFRWNTGF